MRAVVLTRHGGPEVLRITEVPTPEPRPDEVRVRIRVIGINFAEVLSRRGVYGWAPRLPYILGMEAFGEIDALGANVTGRRVGEPVVIGTQFGTYAEFLCLPAARALQAVPRFSPEQNAAFGVGFLTAWIGLMEMARLRPSDTVLVTAAAGGVGSAAVQIAHSFGAKVIGAASAGKQDAVRALGADLAIPYGELHRTKPDVILELVGGDVYKAAVRQLAPLGRVVIGGASDAFPRSRNPIRVLHAMRKMPRVRVFDLLRRSQGIMSFHVGWLLESGSVGPHWRNLVQFAEQHAIAPLIGQQFAFDAIADAHRALETRSNVGKVVVRVA